VSRSEALYAAISSFLNIFALGGNGESLTFAFVTVSGKSFQLKFLHAFQHAIGM